MSNLCVSSHQREQVAICWSSFLWQNIPTSSGYRFPCWLDFISICISCNIVGKHSTLQVLWRNTCCSTHSTQTPSQQYDEYCQFSSFLEWVSWTTLIRRDSRLIDHSKPFTVHKVTFTHTCAAIYRTFIHWAGRAVGGSSGFTHTLVSEIPYLCRSRPLIFFSFFFLPFASNLIQFVFYSATSRHKLPRGT